METKKLSNGINLPVIGMGGWAQQENELIQAINLGYSLIDTAAQYGNEDEVGKAIAHSGKMREAVFVTTKLWNDDVRSGKIREAFESSLRKLNTEYVDLYLIHYPAVGFVEAWMEMIKIYEEGKARAIGVSNFQPHHIEELRKRGLFLPMVNQIEAHPYFANNAVIDYCNGMNIAIEAWCPLGGPNSGILADQTVCTLARNHGKTPSQIILRWQFQRGVITIPKSTNIVHMKENLDIFNFSLNKDEMELMDGINRNARLGADPDNFDF